MLKLLFNRFSKVVYAMEILGVVFTVLWLSKSPPKVLIAVYIAQYLFLRLCTTRRWYSNAKRYEGIELQFKKAMIPVSYIMAITSGVGYFSGSTILLWVACFLIAIVAHVNVILLYLHYKDKNTTPVNYYSHNKYGTIDQKQRDGVCGPWSLVRGPSS